MAEKQDEIVSSSLLQGLSTDFVPEEFDIGMSNWTAPPTKKACAVVDHTNLVSCFSALHPSDFLEKAAKGVIPANTECATEWARKNFVAWAVNRLRFGGERVPNNLLESHNADTICKWLCCFVSKTRKVNGLEYSPSTLQSLVSGINRILQGNKAPFSVLDQSDSHFRDLLQTLDTLTSDLHSSGWALLRTVLKL